MRIMHQLLAGLCFASISFYSLGEDNKNTAQDITESTEPVYMHLQLFGNVFEQVREKYVEEVSDEELINAAIDGMMRSLDPHSSFITGKDAKEVVENTKGSYGGLGIQVSVDESGYILVIAPFDNTPAAKAGIQPGDRITHVDAVSTMNEGIMKSTDKMKGEPGTDVTLTIWRGDSEVFDVVLTREVIKPDPVRWRIEKGSAYIRVADFNARTMEVLKEAITDLQNQEKEQNKQLYGYILDLRSNPGGLLDQAIAMVNAFVEDGEIVSIRGRIEDQTERFTATSNILIERDKPIVVLINAGSASASEIVAGALQDLGRAIIVGERSFGKGSVQSISQVTADGDMLRMTTARYFTPSGRSIQGEGIYPDIDIPVAKIETVERKIMREGDIPGALKSTGNISAEKETPIQDPKDLKSDADETQLEQSKDENSKKEDAQEDVQEDAQDDKKTGEGNKVSATLVEKEIEAAKQDNQLQRALDLLQALNAYNKLSQ